VPFVLVNHDYLAISEPITCISSVWGGAGNGGETENKKLFPTFTSNVKNFYLKCQFVSPQMPKLFTPNVNLFYLKCQIISLKMSKNLTLEVKKFHLK